MRIFYLQPDNKDIQTFEFIASESRCYDDDIVAIEAEPLLDELKEIQNGMLKALGSTGTGTLHYKETMKEVDRLEALIKEIEK